MSKIEESLSRVYTINLSKAWLTPEHKRTDRVINMVKEFAIRHMKGGEIKLDQELNREIWKNGKTNPPRKIRVRITKEDSSVVVSLYEDVVEKSEKIEDKKESQVNDSKNKTK